MLGSERRNERKGGMGRRRGKDICMLDHGVLHGFHSNMKVQYKVVCTYLNANIASILR